MTNYRKYHAAPAPDPTPLPPPPPSPINNYWQSVYGLPTPPAQPALAPVAPAPTPPSSPQLSQSQQLGLDMWNTVMGMLGHAPATPPQSQQTGPSMAPPQAPINNDWQKVLAAMQQQPAVMPQSYAPQIAGPGSMKGSSLPLLPQGSTAPAPQVMPPAAMPIDSAMRKASGGIAKAVRHALHIAKASGGLLASDMGLSDERTPVYRSAAVNALSNPETLKAHQGMNAGTPQQWTKALKRSGVKDEEINALGVNQGDPKAKVSRQDVLARAQASVPKITEKVLGQRDTKSVTSDVNQDDLDYSTGTWETDEPDSSFLREQAEESLNNSIDDYTQDPLQAKKYIPDALEAYTDDWLHNKIDPKSHDPERLKEFITTAVNNGWATPRTASPLMRGKIGDYEWDRFARDVRDSVADKFGAPDGNEQQKTLPFGDSELTPPPARKTTGEHLAPFNEAVQRLHASSDPDVMSHVEDAVKGDDSLLDSYYDMAQDDYYNGEDNPRSTSASISHPGGRDLDYRLNDNGYGNGIDVYHNGQHLGTVDDEDEAEATIRAHAAEKLGKTPTQVPLPDDPNASPIEGPPVYHKAGWVLPGMKNYREHLLNLEPKGGEFTEGHYGKSNILGWIRHGDVLDDKGRRLLHMDELQSDWHQKGKEYGYSSSEDAAAKERAKAELLELSPEVNRQGYEIKDGMRRSLFGHENPNHIAGMLLINPETENEDELRAANRFFRADGDSQKLRAELKNFHNLAAEGIGTDYRDKILAYNNRLQRVHDLEKLASGKHIPDAPWKKSKEWGRLLIKRAMRVAADHGYDGISLSPGWVQDVRWQKSKEDSHKHLYDEVFAGALDAAAKEKGLKSETASIPALKSHAMQKGVGEKDTGRDAGAARAVYFTPESRKKIQEEPFNLFKRGGKVLPKTTTMKFTDGGIVKRALALTATPYRKG